MYPLQDTLNTLEGVVSNRNQESSPEMKFHEDVDKFRTFLLERDKDIEKEIANGRNVADIIYSNFYNRNEHSYKSVNITPEEYNRNLAEISTNLDRKGIKYEKTGNNDGWFYCKTNGGFDEDEGVYRLYFNPQPEYLTHVFKQVAEYCQLWGVRADMKIPWEGNKKTLSRMDKMVLYFNPSDVENLIRISRSILKYNPNAFENFGVPRFTEVIKGLRGISVGQEPQGSEESFGQLRCKILAEVYKEYKKSVDTGIPFTQENFQQNFRYWCTQYGVNPDRPAFNLRRNNREI